MKQTALLIRKDLLLHLGNPAVFLNYILFSITVYVLMYFSGGANLQTAGIAGYWTAFFLAGYLALNRMLQSETQNHSYQALHVAGINALTIYSAGHFSLLILFLTAQFILIPIHSMFFGIDLLDIFSDFFLLFLIIALGYNAVIIVFGRLLAEIPHADFLLPVICFPVQVPLVIAAVELSGIIFSGAPLNDHSNWIWLILFYDMIFLLAGYLLSVLLYE